MTDTTISERRTHLERTAAVLFVGAALVMAIICGAIIVSGWEGRMMRGQFAASSCSPGWG